MSANIFISFASQDRKVATTLCSALESRGFSCWISTRDINPGENFQIAIVRAIRNAKMMLLVFTSNSNASDEMSKELALASQQKLIVVPLRVEDVAPNEAFAYEFATRQWIDFFADWEAAINQLCVRLAQAMPPEQIAPPPTPPPVIAPPPVAATPAAAPPPVVTAPPPSPPVAAPPPPVVAPPPVAKAPEPAPAPQPAPPPKAAQPAPKPTEPVKPEVKAPPPVAKPAIAATASAAPAPAKKGPPMGLFIAIGVVALLIVGAVVALPMLGKKPASQTASAPSAAPALSAAASAAPPPSAAPAVATAPVSAASAAASSAEPAASGAPSSEAAAAAPVAPKHVHKPKAAATERATVKADVPY